MLSFQVFQSYLIMKLYLPSFWLIHVEPPYQFHLRDLFHHVYANGQLPVKVCRIMLLRTNFYLTELYVAANHFELSFKR